MFWWILLGVFGFLLIVGIGIHIKGSYEYGNLENVGLVMWVISALVVICISITAPIVMEEYNKQIDTFICQKQYFETVVPTLQDSDNYALTQKKIELNEWLYKAQYEKTHHAFFTLYSDKVLELTEIK